MVNRRMWLRGMVAALVAGCGYTTRPMYPASVQTVYVPIFQSRVFRRGLEFQLTEAVIKEIERKTQYKVVRHDNADTILEGEIQLVRKRVVIHSPEKEPRQVELAISVDVKWRDLRSGDTLCNGKSETLLVRQSADYVPELGQTIATATQEDVDKLAVQIVAMMEEPW